MMINPSRRPSSSAITGAVRRGPHGVSATWDSSRPGFLIRLITWLVLVGLAAPAAAQLPIVPGAPLTVGMQTRAAYGCGPSVPAILKVTNLNDSGAGSLRAALTTAGPRVVVFETSGYIALASTISINEPCVTIAGQTAPSPGITIRGGSGKETGFYTNTRDVLIQHLRIRMGHASCNSAMQYYGGAQQRVVFDHVSVSWGQDDNIALNWTNGQSTDTTFYRTIVSEGLYRAPNSSSCTGGGTSNGHAIYLGPSSGSSAVVQSLLASNYERNPYMLGDTRVVLLNNVIYQWHGPWGVFFNNGGVSGGSIGGPWYASVVGNRFVPGPYTCCTGGGDDAQAYMFVFSTNGVADVKGNQIFRRDNTLAPSDRTIVEVSNQYSYDPHVPQPPTQAPLPAGYTPVGSASLEEALLPRIGARPTDRDGVDARVIANVTSRAGNFVHDVNEVGGYPPLAVHTRTFQAVNDPHGVTASGYTNLEAQLQAAALALEGGTPVPPEPVGPPDIEPAAGVVFVSDSFEGAAGTPLVAHTGERGASWTKQAGSIDGLQLAGDGGLLNVGLANGTLTLASGAPRSSQYDVAADLRVRSLIAGHQHGIWARAQVADPLTGIAFLYDVSSQVWTLSEFTAGAMQTRGTCVRPLAVGTVAHVVLRVRDTSVHGVIDGVQCASAIDPTIQTAGLVGVSSYFPAVPETAATGIHVDALTATDLTGRAPVTSGILILLIIIGVLALLFVGAVVLLVRAWASAGGL
jgi:hypothetical protein